MVYYIYRKYPINQIKREEIKMIKFIACCLLVIVIIKVNKKAKIEKKQSLLDKIVDKIFGLFY